MERKAPKSLTPYGPFAAVSLLECGGLKPILPFLGGRSDAACRVATSFDKWNCMIETDLRVSRENSPQKD